MVTPTPPENTANENLLDAFIRHQTYLLRYSVQVQGRMNAILAKTEPALAEKILSRLGISTGLTTNVELKRLQALQSSIFAVRAKAWQDAVDYLLTQMVELAYHEPILMTGMVQTSAPVILVDTTMPSRTTLRSIAMSRPFEGRTLKEWAQRMADDDVRRIHNAIQVGMTIGESNQKIASRVVGTGALKHTDGTTELTRTQVTAVTRTAVMHIASQARAAWMQANTDVITAEKFVATLDNRTTPICRALDGNTYDVGLGPVPPLHFGCRSIRVPQFGGEELGNRPAKPVTQKMLLEEYAKENELGKITSRDDLPRGHKGAFDAFERKRIRELTGQVAVTTNYQNWLSDQSNAFQDDTLGIARAKLFRSGGLTLDKFVTRNGDQITLKDLAAKHADAFRAAGLDPEKYL